MKFFLDWLPTILGGVIAAVISGVFSLWIYRRQKETARRGERLGILLQAHIDMVDLPSAVAPIARRGDPARAAVVFRRDLLAAATNVYQRALPAVPTEFRPGVDTCRDDARSKRDQLEAALGQLPLDRNLIDQRELELKQAEEAYRSAMKDAIKQAYTAHVDPAESAPRGVGMLRRFWPRRRG